VTVPYGVLASADGTLLFELNYRGLPTLYSPYYANVAPFFFETNRSVLVHDTSTPLGSYIQPTLVPTNGTLWRGPYGMTPLGWFTLTMWVQSTPGITGSEEILTTLDRGAVTLANQTVTSSPQGSTWTPIVETIYVPYPGVLEVTGQGNGQVPGVRFGGFTLSQIETPVILG
jgi:hypothetical protein